MVEKGLFVPYEKATKRKREGWIPYTSCDLKWDGAKQLAKELRKSGRYEDVEVRRRKPERGIRYGRIYVKMRDDERIWREECGGRCAVMHLEKCPEMMANIVSQRQKKLKRLLKTIESSRKMIEIKGKKK